MSISHIQYLTTYLLYPSTHGIHVCPAQTKVDQKVGTPKSKIGLLHEGALAHETTTDRGGAIEVSNHIPVVYTSSEAS